MRAARVLRPTDCPLTKRQNCQCCQTGLRNQELAWPVATEPWSEHRFTHQRVAGLISGPVWAVQEAASPCVSHVSVPLSLFPSSLPPSKKKNSMENPPPLQSFNPQRISKKQKQEKMKSSSSQVSPSLLSSRRPPFPPAHEQASGQKAWSQRSSWSF